MPSSRVVRVRERQLWSEVPLVHARRSVDGALAEFACGTQVRCRHVRRKRSIAEKIYPPENVNDTARDRSRLPRSEWAQALPTQRSGHCARQVLVFGI